MVRADFQFGRLRIIVVIGLLLFLLGLLFLPTSGSYFRSLSLYIQDKSFIYFFRQWL